jgi:hypothetical protein
VERPADADRVMPGDVLPFEYALKPKYPVKSKSPSAVVYEFYTPSNGAASKPVELTMIDPTKQK